MNRWKAAGLHLAISVLVIVSIIAGVVLLWYPPALLEMSTLDQLIGIIAGIDIVAGPVLTLIVYKRNKPSLRFDLGFIAFFQAALLAYGLHTLAQVRPVFLVGVVDRFEMVAANEILPEDLAKAKPPFNQLSWTGPMLVGAELPFDAGLRAAILDRALAGSDVHVQPAYYVPYDQVRDALKGRAKPIEQLLSRTSPKEAAAILSALADRTPQQTSYVPIHGTYGSALMLIAPDTAEPIAPASVNPWAVEARKSAP